MKQREEWIQCVCAMLDSGVAIDNRRLRFVMNAADEIVKEADKLFQSKHSEERR